MRKKILLTGLLGLVTLTCLPGCRLWCDRYCDDRDRDRYDDYDRRRRGRDCNDPCRYDAPPARYHDDCR